LLDISNKIEKYNLEILLKIKGVTEELKIEYFIVGATVRDMILNYAYGIKIYRSTNDIDFAVRLKNWEEYELLIEKVREAGFREDNKILHRFYYQGIIIDFIPFGDISTKDEIIVWPDDDKREMNIIGFDDAFRNTEDILIKKNPDVIIKASSVEGLVMLKIFSWNDRSLPMRLKDAKDLYLIITTYLRAGNEERLFDEHQDLFEKTEDYDLSGAKLLGRDIKKSVSDKVLKNLLEILEGDKLINLATEMSEYEVIARDTKDEKIELCESLLHNLKLGMTDEVS
jgi:predicted nucleotidyltransferase